MAVSYKYDESEFMNYLKIYFEDIDLNVSKDGSYALGFEDMKRRVPDISKVKQYIEKFTFTSIDDGIDKMLDFS